MYKWKWKMDRPTCQTDLQIRTWLMTEERPYNCRQDPLHDPKYKVAYSTGLHVRSPPQSHTGSSIGSPYRSFVLIILSIVLIICFTMSQFLACYVSLLGPHKKSADTKQVLIPWQPYSQFYKMCNRKHESRRSMEMHPYGRTLILNFQVMKVTYTVDFWGKQTVNWELSH